MLSVLALISGSNYMRICFIEMSFYFSTLDTCVYYFQTKNKTNKQTNNPHKYFLRDVLLVHNLQMSILEEGRFLRCQRYNNISAWSWSIMVCSLLLCQITVTLQLYFSPLLTLPLPSPLLSSPSSLHSFLPLFFPFPSLSLSFPISLFVYLLLFLVCVSLSLFL